MNEKSSLRQRDLRLLSQRYRQRLYRSFMEWKRLTPNARCMKVEQLNYIRSGLKQKIYVDYYREREKIENTYRGRLASSRSNLLEKDTKDDQGDQTPDKLRLAVPIPSDGTFSQSQDRGLCEGQTKERTEEFLTALYKEMHDDLTRLLWGLSSS